MGEAPQNGAVFVFVSRRATRVKLLWWDRNGYCLLYKRLHKAVFSVPRAADGTSAVRVDAAALAQLLAGVPRVEKTRVRP